MQWRLQVHPYEMSCLRNKYSVKQNYPMQNMQKTISSIYLNLRSIEEQRTVEQRIIKQKGQKERASKPTSSETGAA